MNRLRGFKGQTAFCTDRFIYTKRKEGSTDIVDPSFLLLKKNNYYRSVIGLYFGTRDFITTHAKRYATAQIANMIV